MDPIVSALVVAACFQASLLVVLFVRVSRVEAAAKQFAALEARYDNLERSGVSLFAKHNELRDRLDAIAPQPKKEQADVLGRSEAERNEVIGRAALQLLEGKP